ncbi:hypothetical protein C8Q80DRAFT_1124084 [Daedaleopsis nitida]|nr:hypothetical protein C8Q80DRAFT_1124084 [Daedaleopsis nitida]
MGFKQAGRHAAILCKQRTNKEPEEARATTREVEESKKSACERRGVVFDLVVLEIVRTASILQGSGEFCCVIATSWTSATSQMLSVGHNSQVQVQERRVKREDEAHRHGSNSPYAGFTPDPTHGEHSLCGSTCRSSTGVTATQTEPLYAEKVKGSMGKRMSNARRPIIEPHTWRPAYSRSTPHGRNWRVQESATGARKSGLRERKKHVNMETLSSR